MAGREIPLISWKDLKVLIEAKGVKGRTQISGLWVEGGVVQIMEHCGAEAPKLFRFRVNGEEIEV